MKRSSLWFLLLLAGCAERAPSEPVVVVERDSAGIRIVENSVDTAALRAGWAVSDAPLRTIGGLDAPPAEQLFGVNGARRLADGRIAVADRSMAVSIFGPDGTLLAKHGRRGEGPGEFMAASLAGARGDSLIVLDGQLRRISIVHADTGFVCSYAIGQRGGFPVAQGLVDSGDILIGGGMSFSSAEGFPIGQVRPTSRYVVLDAAGSVKADLGEFPAADMFARTRGDAFSARRSPFGRVTGIAAAAGQIWLGTGDGWDLRVYGADAALRRIVRFDRPAGAVTAALRNAYIAEETANADDENAARELRSLIEEMSFPASLPPWELFVPDAAGNVWIGEYLLPGESRRTFTIVNADGHAIGRLTMPPRTLPLDIGPDWLLARTLDALDAESLTLWRLERGTGRS